MIVFFLHNIFLSVGFVSSSGGGAFSPDGLLLILPIPRWKGLKQPSGLNGGVLVVPGKQQGGAEVIIATGR